LKSPKITFLLDIFIHTIDDIDYTIKKLDDNNITYKLFYLKNKNNRFFFKIYAYSKKLKNFLEELKFYSEHCSILPTADDMNIGNYTEHKWIEFPKNVDIEVFINVDKYNL